jgi:membrane protease YdiL (CAAX protease family)
MTAEPPPELVHPPEPLGGGPRPLSLAITVICTLLVAAWVVWALLPVGSGTEHLEFPELSLERIVTRGLDVRDALRQAPAWERTIYLFPLKDDDTLDEALEWYQRLGHDVASPASRLHTMILLAEAGMVEGTDTTHAFANAVARADAEGELDPRAMVWLRAAYLEPRPGAAAAQTIVAEIHDVPGEDWFTDTLVARIADRIGDRETLAAAQSAIATRGDELLDRLRGLMIISVGLIISGGVALLYVIRQRPDLTIGEAPLPPIWPLLDGYGLFVRGVLGYLAINALGEAAKYLLPWLSPQTPHFGVVTMVATVPLLWCVARYAEARGTALRSVLGLSLPRGGRPFAVVTLSLLALSLGGGTVIDVAGNLLDVEEDWTDFVQEDLLWGSNWLALSDTIDSTLWVPFVEEVAFRGLLYSTLRTHFGVLPSAGVSAVVFAGGHGYGLIGLLSVFWSGLLWAVGYERTRSLLPGIVAHGVENLLATVSFAAMYRF